MKENIEKACGKTAQSWMLSNVYKIWEVCSLTSAIDYKRLMPCNGPKLIAAQNA